MPSPTAVIDLLKSALRKKGIISAYETPTADQVQDSLRALNEVLERWSLQSYAVWAGLPETFATVDGQAVYTVGPGGDWDTDRPISLGTVYASYEGSDFPVQPWTYAQYAGVAVKADSGTIPERIVYMNDAPLARVILYPAPVSGVTVTVDLPRILTQISDASQSVSFPPGYVEALTFAVAEAIGMEYGSPIDLSAAARSSLALIKRANRSSPIATFDATLLRCGGGVGGGGGGGYVGPSPDEWSATEW